MMKDKKQRKYRQYNNTEKKIGCKRLRYKLGRLWFQNY